MRLRPAAGFRSRRDEYEQLAHVISPALAAPRCTGRVSVDHGPSLTRTRSPGTRKSSLLAPPLAFVTRTSTLEARPSRCWIGLEGDATLSGSRLSGDGKARLQHLDHSRSEPLRRAARLANSLPPTALEASFAQQKHCAPREQHQGHVSADARDRADREGHRWALRDADIRDALSGAGGYQFPASGERAS
jgi:hypothetical protein